MLGYQHPFSTHYPFFISERLLESDEKSALQNPLNEKKGKQILNRHISSHSRTRSPLCDGNLNVDHLV